MSIERKTWDNFVARYYGDASFASEVDKDPTEAMRKAGIEIPTGMKACLHKNTKNEVHVCLPPNPAEGLRNEDLSSVYGGTMSTQGSC